MTATARLERSAVWLVAIGLLAITGMTFITSFDAIAAVAVDRGAVSPRLAWAIPLAIDGQIVVGSAATWLESIRRERWHPFPIVLVAVAAALSVAANVAHAGTDADWLARALAAVPPVFLLSSVELGAWLMRRQNHPPATRSSSKAGKPEPAPEPVTVTAVRAEPDRSAPANGKLTGAAEETAAFVRAMVDEGRATDPRDTKLTKLVQDHFEVGKRAALARLKKARDLLAAETAEVS
jgi:hypothetical protein